MAELMLVNPKKRKSPKRKSVAKRKSPKRSRSRAVAAPKRRYKRNPTTPRIMDQVINAATGAAGALAVDVAMARLPLPANLTATPIMRSATQGAVSLAIGMLVSNFGKKRKLGRQLAEGGLTVALHGMGKGLIGPTLGLSGMDDTLLGYDDGSLLGYEDLANAGWVNPAGAQDFPEYNDLGEMEDEDYDDFG